MELHSSTQFLQKLFLPSEHVCFAAEANGINVYPQSTLRGLNPTPVFVSLNPLDPVTDRSPTKDWHRADRPRRADANVVSLRNILVEFDRASLEEQINELIEKAVPYTTLVFSGKKSVHAIIALTEPLESVALYKDVFKALNAILPGMDPSCKNPSRLTRLPGVVRPDTGLEQQLLDVRRRVTQSQLFSWLSKYETIIESSRRSEANARVAQDEARERGELQQHTLEFLRGERTTKGSRHNRLVAAAFEMLECGVEYGEALMALEQAADLHGITSEPGREGEAESIANYVYGAR